MQVKLVKIGNSQGIRLPKAVLDQVGLTGVADLSVENGKIVLRPEESPRAGWEEAFAATSTDYDEEDREWLEADLFDDKDWTW